MAVHDTDAERIESQADWFEQPLGQPEFGGLKAIWERLSPERERLPGLVSAANSYAELLTGLGYRLTMVRLEKNANERTSD